MTEPDNKKPKKAWWHRLRLRLWPDLVLFIALAFILRNNFLILAATHKIESVNQNVHASTTPKHLGVDQGKGTAAFNANPTLSPTAQAEAAALQKKVEGFVASQTVPFSIYIKDLKTNALAKVNSDQAFPAASLYKLYVANLVFHQIDLGKIHLSTPVGQTGHNVHECLGLMITVSDNDCGQGLGAMVGWDLSNSVIADQGYTQSNLNDPPMTSAGDCGKLLEHLYQQLDEASNNDQLVFLELLKHQAINDLLPAGLPDGTIIAHKTGNIDDYVHDVGIVYGPKTTYVISVLSGPWPNPNDAPAAFAQLSQVIYNQTQQ